MAEFKNLKESLYGPFLWSHFEEEVWGYPFNNGPKLAVRWGSQIAEKKSIEKEIVNLVSLTNLQSFKLPETLLVESSNTYK